MTARHGLTLLLSLGKLVAAGFITAVITVAVFTILSGQSKELADRVDANADLAVKTAALSARVALENRYVSACALFTPPYPERTVEDLQVCLEEAVAMPTTVTPETVDDYLADNLEHRLPPSQR